MSGTPRLIFAGTPEFASRPLQALLQAGVPVQAVYTQPDRPAGRGRKLSPSPVKQVALEHAIEPSMTAGGLHDALVALGQAHLPRWMQQYCAGELAPQPQDDAQATYAHKLSKAEALLDWQQPAEVLARKIRAFDPWPGTAGRLDGDNVKLSGLVGVEAHSGAPGDILSLDEQGLRIACGQGSVCISQIQFPGARRMSVQEAARGRSLQGLRFD